MQETDMMITRRNLLVSAARLSTGLIAPLSAAKKPAMDDTHTRLAGFLTGHRKLEPVLVASAYAALLGLHRIAPGAIRILSAVIDASGAKNVDEFFGLPASQPQAVRTTALEIIGALYLGRCISPYGPENGFAYGSALMFGPTRGLGVIPSYCGGAPGYWKEAPHADESLSPISPISLTSMS
jgi:hypothetical protein